MRDLTSWDVVPGVLCDVFAHFVIEALNRKERKVDRKEAQRKSFRAFALGPCLRWFIGFSTGRREQIVLYSRTRCTTARETLTVGSRAPEFLLPAANRDGILSL